MTSFWNVLKNPPTSKLVNGVVGLSSSSKNKVAILLFLQQNEGKPLSWGKKGCKESLCYLRSLSSKGALYRSKCAIPGWDSCKETKVTGSSGWAEGQRWNSWKRNNGRVIFRKSFSLRQLHNCDTLGCQREPSGLFQSSKNHTVLMLNCESKV